MASRVVEVLYKLKDLFTPIAKKIEKSYKDLGKGADKASESVEKTNEALGGTLGKLQQRFNTLKSLARGGVIGKAIFEFGQLIKDSSDTVLDLARNARRLGVTGQELLDFKDIAAETSVKVSELESAFGSINSRINSFNAGSKLAAKQFKNLGIDAEKFSELDAAEKMERLAQAVIDLGGGDAALAQVGRLIGAKPGDGLLLLIEQGPSAVRAISEAAEKTGKAFDQDVEPAALRIDSLSKSIATSWDSITGNIRDALVKGAGAALEAFNVGDTDLQALRKEENELLRERETLEKAIRRGGQANKAIEDSRLRRYKQLVTRLGEVQKATANIESTREGERRAAELNKQLIDERIKGNEEWEESEKKLTETISDQTKKVSANLRTQRNEYRAARNDQIAVERAFQNLINDVTGEDISVEDVALGDVFGKLNQALSAQERGNLDEAVSLAIDGADYLSLLKEKGTETQGTLGFLAKQLSDVANASAAARAQAEQQDVFEGENLIAQLEAQQAAINAQGEVTGVELAKSVNDGYRAELAKLDWSVPVAPAPAASGYIEWADDPSSRRRVDGKIVK